MSRTPARAPSAPPHPLVERNKDLLEALDRPNAEPKARLPLMKEQETLLQQIIERESLIQVVRDGLGEATLRRIEKAAARSASHQFFRGVKPLIRSQIVVHRTNDILQLAAPKQGSRGRREYEAIEELLASTLAAIAAERAPAIESTAARKIDDEMTARARSLARRFASADELDRLRALERTLGTRVGLTGSEVIRARDERDAILTAARSAGAAVQFELNSARWCGSSALRIHDLRTRPLFQDHIDELALSTIDADQARAAGLWSEDWPPLISHLLNAPVREPADDHLVFPCYRPGGAAPAAFRLKRTSGGDRRYLGPTGESAPVYYPPGVLSSGDLGRVDKLLVITEGEKKGLALDRMGYCVVALAGVTNHHDVALKRANNELKLHPWIREDVQLADRDVVIAFDPNVTSNPSVAAEARKLAGSLWAAGVREVRLVAWETHSPSPERPGIVDGVDDLARVSGDQAVHDLIAGARAFHAGGIFVPDAIAEREDLSSTLKVAYGALHGFADRLGVVSGVSQDELAELMCRSRSAVSRTIDGLVAAKLVKRAKSACIRTSDGGWRAERDRYELCQHGRHQDAVRVEMGDLSAGASAALVLAVLRRCSTQMKTVELMAATGLERRTLSNAVKRAGHQVRHRHGLYALGAS